MAVNKLALIRYKTIDKCLQNTYRKWTLDNLIEKVSDALFEYEGISSGVSKRTIQADIQLMRSDKLGYNAPIVIRDRKYYVYDEPGYSISNSNITDADLNKMSEIVSVLKELNGFNFFDDMNEIIARLENNIIKSKNSSDNIIQLEGNSLLKGLDHILPLYKAIRARIPLLINYQSFKAKDAKQQVYSPYLLKEYRNRWFLIALQHRGKGLITLALDRILDIMEMTPKDFVPYKGVDFERYFDDVIGVTTGPKSRANKVILFFDAKTAPYVLTKPIHHSQQLLKEDENGIMIRIDVVLNFELEREILGFGENVKVLSPKNLQRFIRNRIEKMHFQYQDSSS